MNNSDNNETDGSSCGCGGGTCCGGPGKWIWIILIAAIAGVLVAKNAAKKEQAPSSAVGDTPAVQAGIAVSPGQARALPRLVDLGSTTCIPCKAMAPILEDLKTAYAGEMDVQFIDVREKPEDGKIYNINLIPTQIFFDASGKELFRHEGFFSKEDILAKWKELGVEFASR